MPEVLTLGNVHAQRGSPPSTYAILAAVEGQPGAIPRVLGTTLLRSFFLAPGLMAVSRILDDAKVPRFQKVALGALAASASASIFLLAWYSSKKLAGREINHER